MHLQYVNSYYCPVSKSYTCVRYYILSVYSPVSENVGLGVGSWPSNRTNAGSPPSEFDYTS